MANVLELPLGKEDGLSTHVCELCNARFKQLVRSLEVYRLQAKKSYDKLAKKAGIFVELLEDPVDNETPVVEDAKNPKKDPLVEAADMTSMDLGSLLSDLVAAKKRMREKSTPTEKKVVTDDIKDLMNLLSGIRKEDVFVFGTFLGIPEPTLRDIEMNYSDNFQRLLTEVVTTWINVCPDTATWPNLVEALTEVGRRKTAQEIAERRGIVVPGAFDDGQLWKALKALIPINEGGDLLTLMDETEKLRTDVKAKDALLVESEERLEEVNKQKQELDIQYEDTLQKLKEQEALLDIEKRKAQKVLREKEAELRKMRSERASKEEIESMEIEIMYLKKKVQQQQQQERELMEKIVDLQEKLEATDFNRLEWIASNLEKQLDSARPEFEQQRSKMMNNIYKMLKYIKIPDDLEEEVDEEGQNGSPDPELAVTAEEEKEDIEEEIVQETTPEPEPADLESLLLSLKSPINQETAISLFEDKPFVKEDHAFAVNLFQNVPPFLLSQILGLTMDQWKAIEAVDVKNEHKQLSNVIQEWGKSYDTAKWSVLVETLVELGLRGKAQMASVEKGVPLPEVHDDGPVWCSIKERLIKGNDQVQQYLGEMEGLRLQVKDKDEILCAKESQLERARLEGELIKANLMKLKQDLTMEMSQCKALETQMKTQDDLADPLFKEDPDPELSELKEQHRQHMNAVESLWKQQEATKVEFETHNSKLEPQQQQSNVLREIFAGQREHLVAKLEEMYDLYTGREKPVPKEAPIRPPPPKPVPPKPVPPSPVTPPGGYRAFNELRPDTDSVMPTGYTILDLFNPQNKFSLLPVIDLVGRPIAVFGNALIGVSIKGRGSLNQECTFTSEIVAPFVITLRLPNRGRLMVNDQRVVSIKNTSYELGKDPSFEFIVRPYRDTKVTFESRKFPKSFLSVNQNAQVYVQEMPLDSGEVQFAVRVQRFAGPYTTHLTSPLGKPSIVNQLRDRCVIQLYSKATGLYLGIKFTGSIGPVTNPENDSTYITYCDRGLGRVSLESHTRGAHKIKMRFNGMLNTQGDENLDNDFYLKENPDGTVVFESVPNKGRYISIHKDKHTIIRNFNIMLLEFTRAGTTVIKTKRQLN